MLIFANGVTITEDEAAVLEHDIANIETWVANALAGKIQKASHRFTSEWLPRLQADDRVQSIASTRSGFIAQVLAHPDYLDHVGREAAEEALQQDRSRALLAAPAG